MNMANAAFGLILIILSACVAGAPARQTSPPYPYTHSFYDLTVSWKADRGAEEVAIPGTVQNTSFYYLRDLELTATLLDGEGKSISEQTFFFFPNLLRLDEVAPFRLRLPVKAGKAPQKIRFFYRYRLAEEGLKGSPRTYSFEAPLTSSSPRGE